MFGPLIALVKPRSVTDGDVTRFFAVLQTILDSADPSSWAVHVLEERLVPGRTPSVLEGVVLDDDTVPNVSNYALARALGLSIVPPVLREEPFVEVTGPPPISGNFSGGTATGGLLQFDVIRRKGGELIRATHGNVGGSEVGAAAWLEFLRGEFEDGLAVIVDPYQATDLDHADPP
jgi:hypothetical protein